MRYNRNSHKMENNQCLRAAYCCTRTPLGINAATNRLVGNCNKLEGTVRQSDSFVLSDHRSVDGRQLTCASQG